MSTTDVLMCILTDVCREAKLTDRETGLSATFPTTKVNRMALSKDKCGEINFQTFLSVQLPLSLHTEFINSENSF